MSGQFFSVTLPPPRGGLNVIDGLDAPESRPLEDARVLTNLYPRGATVDVRGGIETFCTVSGGDPVRTLAALPLKDGSTQLIAATDNKLYRVDTGTAGNETGATTPTSDDWNTTVFSHRLFLCNGADTVQVYDGASTADCTFTGVTLADLINVSSYHERLFFVEKDSASFWFGNTQAVGASALSEFPLDYYLKFGGRLLFSGSFTNQRGQSSQDLFMAVSSEGEVLFYTGSNPGSASTWALIARFYIGKPLGYGAFVEVEDDTWIITDGGIVSVAYLFANGPTIGLQAVGRKINPIISQYAKSTPFSHLWRGEYWKQGKRVFIQVPRSPANTFLLVYNIETKAWCKYEYNGISSLSLACVEDLPYLGGAGGLVYEAENSQSDNGAEIQFSTEFPFSFFGARGNFKKFLDLRPLMKTGGGVRLGVAMDTDFRRNGTLSELTSGEGDSTSWDEATWDVDPWASDSEYTYERYSLAGQGHSGALRISGGVKNVPLELSAFEIRFEAGGQV